MPRTYSGGLGGGTLLVVVLVGYIGGARGAAWLLWVVLALYPALFIALYLARWFLPPDLEIGDKPLFKLEGAARIRKGDK